MKVPSIWLRYLIMTAVIAGFAIASPAVADASPAAARSVPASPAATQTFTLYNLGLANRCLGIATNGNAGSYACNGTADQIWHFGAPNYPTGTLSSFHQLINNHGKCLGVSGSSATEGARVVATTCSTSHADQYWAEYDRRLAASYYYTFLNLHSGYVISVASASTFNGQPVIQWLDEDLLSQYWGGDF